MKTIYVLVDQNEIPLQQVWVDEIPRNDDPSLQWLRLIEVYPNGKDAPNVGLVSAVVDRVAGTLTRTFDTVPVVELPPEIKPVPPAA